MCPHFGWLIILASLQAFHGRSAAVVDRAAPWPTKRSALDKALDCKTPPALKQLIGQLSPDALARQLEHMKPAKIADQLSTLGPAKLGNMLGKLKLSGEVGILLGKLPLESLEKVVAKLPSDQVGLAINNLGHEELVGLLSSVGSAGMEKIIENLSDTDLAAMLKDLPEATTKAMLDKLSEDDLNDLVTKIIGEDAFEGVLGALRPNALADFVQGLTAKDLKDFVGDFEQLQGGAAADLVRKLQADPPALVKFAGGITPDLAKKIHQANPGAWKLLLKSLEDIGGDAEADVNGMTDEEKEMRESARGNHEIFERWDIGTEAPAARSRRAPRVWGMGALRRIVRRLYGASPPAGGDEP